MSNTKINLDKLILSFLKSNDYNNLVILDALKEQGLEVRDGELVESVAALEDEPTSEIKAKFKEGDWVVNGHGFVMQIIKPKDGVYRYCYEGKLLECTFEKLERSCRLWTINDAKDGDVLAVEPIEGYPSSFVAIHKKQNGEDFDSYCFIGFDGKFYKGENEHSTEEIHPATKEQSDLLFKKMKEARYEWDTEAKQLQEIEEWCPQVGDVFRKKGTEKPLYHLCSINENGNFSFVEDRISGIAGGTDISAFTLKREYEFVEHWDTDPFKEENGTKNMKLYIGVNSDGSCIISKQKLKRFINYEINKQDVFSYNDTKMPPHWILDYTNVEVPHIGDMPIDRYLTLPKGAIERMFGIHMTWNDEYREIEL